MIYFNVSVEDEEEKRAVMDVISERFQVTRFRSKAIEAKHPKGGNKRHVKLWIRATKLPKKH